MDEVDYFFIVPQYNRFHLHFTAGIDVYYDTFYVPDGRSNEICTSNGTTLPIEYIYIYIWMCIFVPRDTQEDRNLHGRRVWRELGGMGQVVGGCRRHSEEMRVANNDYGGLVVIVVGYNAIIITA